MDLLQCWLWNYLLGVHDLYQTLALVLGLDARELNKGPDLLACPVQRVRLWVGMMGDFSVSL